MPNSWERPRPFGHMYAKNASFVITVASSGVAYEVDPTSGTPISAGLLGDVTFPGDHYLEVKYAGRYHITYSLSGDTTGGNDEIECGIMVNGVEKAEGGSHTTIAAASAGAAMSGSCILLLTAGQQISMYVRNHTAARDITIEHMNVTVVGT